MGAHAETILQLLRDAGTYISGDLIGRECAISCTAVWKQVHSLRELGYDIESCRKRGYRLRGSADAPLPWEVSAHLGTAAFGRRLEYLATVDSTNRIAVERAQAGAPEGTTIELLVHEAHAADGPPLLNTHFDSWTRFTCRQGSNEFESFDFESLRWLQLHIHSARGLVKIRNIRVRRRVFPWPVHRFFLHKSR